jgi:hypothetical protein
LEVLVIYPLRTLIMQHLKWIPSMAYSKLACLALLGWACSTPVEALGQFSGAEPVPADWKVGFDSINAETAQEYLSLLAGPKFEGRGTGQPGYTKAAHWVAGKAAEFGLQPAGDNGTYFQMLPMTQLMINSEGTKLSGPNGLLIPSKSNLGFDRFAEQPLVSGKVVFMTLSGPLPQFEEGQSLRDKIVIYTSDRADGRSQMLLARERPAAALRVVENSPSSGKQLLREGAKTRSTSVSGTITKTAALEVLKAVGGEASWLESKSASTVHMSDAEL